jgi:hypothetical protein
MLWQLTPAALKSSLSPSPPVEPPPEPLPARDLPEAVWVYHLLWLLTFKDAGGWHARARR